ncbi:MAG TPA: glycosyltransferase family 2 protein [Chitinophagaceae bacterium]|nr:glycosyltransferase family 2 protein [Chitinophagaceae bacterium]
MFQILVPLAGGNAFFSDHADYQFPKPLIEINGKPMIQWVFDNLQTIEKEELKYIFVVKEEDCIRFHLDQTIAILSDGKSSVIRLKEQTQGAVCSCLMAIDELDLDSPLLITNGDQILDKELPSAIQYFEDRKFDGGVITFESVHPKWSFARFEKDTVVETAEKRPISRNAIAGVYYFKKAGDFVTGSFEVIKKNINTNGLFFISSTVNELILSNKRVGYYSIPNELYHSFYSPQKIKEFENLISK